MSFIIIVALSEADTMLFEENQIAQCSRWCTPPAGSKHMPPPVFTTRAGSASAGRGKHSIGRWPEEQYRPAGECHCGGACRDSAGGRTGVGHCRASLGSNTGSGPTYLSYPSHVIEHNIDMRRGTENTLSEDCDRGGAFHSCLPVPFASGGMPGRPVNRD